MSLSGADAAHLVLHNVDLTTGRFLGTIHLDQLRLEGHCPLAPAGPRWTKRHTLAALAPVYRQLRKSFEDSKNEQDAADFHYGEMTMRRLDPTRAGGRAGTVRTSP
ncbi:hypothetical protein ACUXZZ_00645 [Streptomyces graminifolii]|uniref:hypothetical protein n=1 Tax=Streptomyces graminifolii TaxID=1266771 RepID=UPI0040597CED